MNGIILASGFSRRMGKNKLLMNIGEEVILQKVIREIKKSDISNIILVAREDNVIEIGIREEIQVIKNESATYGQRQSIKVGLTKVNANQNFMFFCGDQPFIDSSSINKLITASIRLKDNIKNEWIHEISDGVEDKGKKAKIYWLDSELAKKELLWGQGAFIEEILKN